MVPINVALSETREDKNALTEVERWKHYGQGDHVRVYTRSDFVDRLSSVGLHVTELSADFFGKNIFKLCGLTGSSVLYVVERR